MYFEYLRFSTRSKAINEPGQTQMFVILFNNGG
jgi:hypothetical protein